MNGASPRALVTSAGAFCPVGGSAAQVSASVRAGISRLAQSSVHDRYFAPFTLGCMGEEDLEALAEPLAVLPITARQRRMLRLGAPALREALVKAPAERVPLFLGLPEVRPRSTTTGARLLESLAQQAGVGLDASRSQVFEEGRAAALLALEAALQWLEAGHGPSALVGGVDTCLDLAQLSELDAEGRILTERRMEGFIPGEGAAFLLLSTAGSGSAGSASARDVGVFGAALARDKGHRYSDEPAMGEGLSLALEALRSSARIAPKSIELVLAGLNGESFGAKEWGVASLRHQDLFSPRLAIEHPAQCYGDAGAATGALLLAVAATLLRRGSAKGPALVWSSSDREPCGCALLGRLGP